MTSEMKRKIAGWAVKALIARTVVAAVLFLAAGTLRWAMGWGFAGLYAAFDLATALVVIPRSPDLLLERTRIGPGTKTWDKLMLRLSAGYLPLAAWIVAGLDLRLGWRPEVPLWLQLAAAVAVALGFAIVVWAMSANPFFSATVRIQTERGHTVATGGPYRFVRHPGYVGAMLFQTMMALMLGSWWALIPAGLSAVAYIVRTALEDKTLQAELDGYKDYAARVRYRLLPGVW